MLHNMLRAAAGRDRIPTDGLVAWYSMDTISGGTLFDDAGSNDGTIYGATQVAGIGGNALDFDGSNDFVSIQDAAILQFGTGDFFISGWFNADVISYGPSDSGILVSKNFTGLEVYIYQGTLSAYVGGTSNPPPNITISSTGIDYFWYIKREGSIVKLCLGSSTTSATNTASASNSGQSVILGNRPSSSYYFNGRQAKIRLYNRSLDESEIQLLREEV